MAHWASTNCLNDTNSSAYGEAELVRAAQDGDRHAFQQLIFRYDRLVLAFALNVTQSEEGARHIYEQVFVKAFKSLPAASIQISLFVWFYRIAASCCQQYLVEESRRRQKASRGGALSPSQPSPGPQLWTLSVRERIVFVLAHHGRLRATTIAQIMNVSVSSAKEALVRAVYKLKESQRATDFPKAESGPAAPLGG